MAALDAVFLQLAESLTLDEIPAKLRCAACNKLAINAMKLPCCDQALCEPCTLDLPGQDQCPICEHSPLAAEECKVNKNLRMTIKAFLKSEEKKRIKDVATPVLPPALGEAAPVLAPSETPGLPPTDELAATDKEEGTNGNVQVPVLEDANVADQEALSPTKTSQHQSGAVDDETMLDQGDADQEEEEDEEDEDDIIITTERPEHELQQTTGASEEGPFENNGQEQGQGQYDGQQGFDPTQQGPNNMDFGSMANFNPMMGMGMPGFPMGMPNMMNMPGMNMDPSMMFGGGFGAGMGGMNDMNMMGMGMGMNGFGGIPGMNMGNSGFFHGQGGYNQQNFGNHMNQNFHQNRGFGGGRPYNNRGFGRGRGFNNYNGRGGGGFGYNAQQGGYGRPQSFGHQNEGFPNQQNQQQNVPAQGDGVDNRGRRGSANYGPFEGAENAATDGNRFDQDTNQAGDNAADGPAAEQSGSTEKNGVDEATLHQMTPDVTSTPAPPINAPKGPKAMREGKPNTGWRPPAPPVAPSSATPQDVDDRYQHPDNDDHMSSHSRSRSRHRSHKTKQRSASEDYESDGTYRRRKDRERRKRKEKERRHDEESYSRDSDGHDMSSRKDRSKDDTRDDDSSSRRYRDKEDDYKSSRSHRDREHSRDKRKSRHRSRSAHKDTSGYEESDDRSKRKTKTGHNDYDELPKSRDSDKDRSERRSRRDDDYDCKDRSSRYGRSGREEGRDRARDRERDRDHDRDRAKPVREPYSDAASGFKIKGSTQPASTNAASKDMGPPSRSARRDHTSDRRTTLDSTPNTPSNTTTPTPANTDPYAEERERRHKDRVAKEQQRRQSTQSLAKRRASPDEEDDYEAPSGPRGDRNSSGRKNRKERRVNVKYEGEVRYDERDDRRWD